MTPAQKATPATFNVLGIDPFKPVTAPIATQPINPVVPIEADKNLSQVLREMTGMGKNG